MFKDLSLGKKKKSLLCCESSSAELSTQHPPTPPIGRQVFFKDALLEVLEEDGDNSQDFQVNHGQKKPIPSVSASKWNGKHLEAKGFFPPISVCLSALWSERCLKNHPCFGPSENVTVNFLYRLHRLHPMLENAAVYTYAHTYIVMISGYWSLFFLCLLSRWYALQFSADRSLDWLVPGKQLQQPSNIHKKIWWLILTEAKILISLSFSSHFPVHFPLRAR